MKKRFLELLKGSFLTSGDAVKNWRFILFASVLAVIMISSAHQADRKVHELAKLNDEVLELRSEFVDVRTQVQRIKLESNVMDKVVNRGLIPSVIPPQKIRVASKR
ncbi:S-adenosyl-methyltransferase [Robertkochia solimangrovi]|nr:FtsL-like putative cell division protein [Robertkochia solimangrovi]TRZ44501.1 S-adenosyl-methyltransferase [Robertkochia solimangrovi]